MTGRNVVTLLFAGFFLAATLPNLRLTNSAVPL